MAGARPFCVRIGACWAVGRSTPLKPMRERTLHRSSNESVEPVQTEAITLCLMRVRGAAGGVWADSWPAIPVTRGAATPVKNVLRSIGVNIPCRYGNQINPSFLYPLWVRLAVGLAVAFDDP